MKVLHINTNDRGGAATAIIRIHLELLNKGVDSKILFLNKRKDIPQSFGFVNTNSKLKRAVQKLKGLFSTSAKAIREKHLDIEWFSDPTSPYDITEHPLYKEADIIQLNWVSGFLDEPSFFKKNTKPVVWRMPDLYTCGGGYHYEKEFPFSELKSKLNRNEKLRKRALSNANIIFVPISEWIHNKANESTIIAHFPKQMIHNGLNFGTFKPRDPLKAIKKYNLPQDKKIILLGADISHVKRKGLALAIQALSAFDSNMIQPVLFGRYHKCLPSHFIQVGYIQEEEDLANLYSASALFLMPSIEEAFGQVTIEALACGTPVISFPNGGSMDIIKNGLNGYLAADFTKEELIKAIEKGLYTPFNQKVILDDIRERFYLSDKINQYISLYHDLYKSLEQ